MGSAGVQSRLRRGVCGRTDRNTGRKPLVDKGFRGRADDVVVIPDGAFAGGKVIYMKDPDGYHVELFERPRL